MCKTRNSGLQTTKQVPKMTNDMTCFVKKLPPRKTTRWSLEFNALYLWPRCFTTRGQNENVSFFEYVGVVLEIGHAKFKKEKLNFSIFKKWNSFICEKLVWIFAPKVSFVRLAKIRLFHLFHKSLILKSMFLSSVWNCQFKGQFCN